MSWQKILLGIFIFLLSSIICSVALTTIGDKLLILDHFNEAQTLYKSAKIFNPLSKKISQRELIINTIKEERKGESEETEIDDKPIVFANAQHNSVLGVSVTIPVLMYHYIRINPNPTDKVGFNLSVTPGNFAAQMDYLATHNYHSISLDRLGAVMLGEAKLPQNPIVITFDDGYKDVYTAAFPILKAHGFNAVSFVITGFVGGPNYLNWDQIKQMQGSGLLTFGSHTVNHIALVNTNIKRIQQEVLDSKNVLQSHLGYPINWIAYPYGSVNGTTANVVKQTGYIGAFGTNNGTYQSTDNELVSKL